MSEPNNKPDPANPEQKAIADSMERDGEFLRDVREGKTPTEQAFGLDLGSKEIAESQAEHDALITDLGEVVAEETARTAPPEPDTSPIAIEAPDVGPPPTRPVAELTDEHNGLFQELGTTATQAADERLAHPGAAPTPEQKRSARTEEMAKRRVEHRLRSEHGEAFVELAKVVEDANPAPIAPLGPADLARIAHPGKEKPESLEEAIAGFAHEDKLWRAAVVDLFKAMESDIRQHRLELESVRGSLERGR